MDCLVLPVSVLRKRYMGGSRHGYRALRHEDGYGEEVENLVTVVVGKEKREFLVDPFVLEQNPFRVLMQAMIYKQEEKEKKEIKCIGYGGGTGKKKKKKKEVVFVDVDAILFEHMLWLMNNDSSSLFQLNLLEIIDFYGQDN
ncbi:hypothetical protein FNV43_RR10180 [Rhamnella rubrinervis]|uniref:Uncharacterized protein n=1 Tax=Rhamnella rubrinervis TaxID=2594499 RepID=A0A8K0MKM7_9ROSA|nr:hypothetical protein FNV43_RR10180 [Rhamnella rubrinervis]